MANPDFRSALAEVLDFARGRYEACYKSDSEFVVGKKYTYEDVFRLLSWKKNEVALNVGELIDTIEYDYPTFHLSMKCYDCSFAGGSPHLLEHEAAKWLSSEQLRSVDWLPADVTLIPKVAAMIKGEC